MSRCWYHFQQGTIDPAAAIRPGWKFPADLTPGIWQIDKPLDVFRAEWLLELSEIIGAKVTFSMLFYRRPWFKHQDAHIDVELSGQSRIFAINWMIGGSGSEMRWYETPAAQAAKLETTSANTKYQAWPTETLTLVDTYVKGTRPILVRTDIPHAIINKAEGRWCFSLRPLLDPEPKSWDETVHLFSTLIDRPSGEAY